MIAPGVSYSQERPGGYTQADLNEANRFYSEGRAPVLNLGTGQGAYVPIPDQMLYAPPGTTIEKFVQPEPRTLGEKLPPGVDNGIDFLNSISNREDTLKGAQAIFGPQVQYATEKFVQPEIKTTNSFSSW